MIDIWRYDMEQPKTKSPFHIGMRNLKTALAATLCALLYFPLDRNPTFACIGAIFGMGSDMDNSKLNGGNRLFGTVIGGLVGMAVFQVYIWIYPDGEMRPLMLLFLFIGVILLVLMSTLFQWPGAIPPGGVVLCIILFNTPVDTFISYSLNRVFDTAIGVIIGIATNYFLPRERVIRWKHAVLPKRDPNKNKDEINDNNQKED